MYVFGVDMPIMEILVVEFILVTFGLLYVLIEIKKLRKLLFMEKEDISRFEHDLGMIEQDSGKKVSEPVIQFVKKAMSQNMPKENIEKVLLNKGWSKSQVSDIFNKV